MERNFDLISCTLKTKVSVNKYKWQSMKKKMHTNVLAPAFDIAIFNDQAKTMNSMLGENGEIISEYMYLYMLEGMLSTKQNQSKWQLNKNSACVKKEISWSIACKMLVKWVHLLWKHTCIISCSPALELRQTISSSLFADKNFPLLPFRAILPCYVENKTTFIHIRIKIWSHFPVTNSNSYVFHAKHIYHMKKFVLLVMVLFWGVFSKACVCEHSPIFPIHVTQSLASTCEHLLCWSNLLNFNVI